MSTLNDLNRWSDISKRRDDLSKIALPRSVMQKGFCSDNIQPEVWLIPLSWHWLFENILEHPFPHPAERLTLARASSDLVIKALAQAYKTFRLHLFRSFMSKYVHIKTKVQQYFWEKMAMASEQNLKVTVAMEINHNANFTVISVTC